MLPILFPIVCIVAGCVAALFTRSKLYAIVLPSLVLPVFSTIGLFTLSRSDEIGEGAVLASPFIVAGFFMSLMYEASAP